MKLFYIPVIRLLFFVAVNCMSLQLMGAYVSFQETYVTDSDGTRIVCYASGDEYYNWLHDKKGYTIIQNHKDGNYYFAVFVQGKLVCSEYRAKNGNPQGCGLTPWTKIPVSEYNLKKGRVTATIPVSMNAEKSQKTGEMNNLIVFIRFSDDSEFTVSRQVYDDKFNAEMSNSVKSYFNEVSYNKLQISSSHFPICQPNTNLSFQDKHIRNYYLPYNEFSNPAGYSNMNERTEREQRLLVNAIRSISSQVPSGLNLDFDNNNRIDNVCFIIKGNNGNWADLLWSHRWILFSDTVSVNGKSVYDYTFHPENQTGVNTLCHELFHVLGAPDLYNTNSQQLINPVGSWDIMECGSGHMGAYMKWKYSGQQWIESIPEIKTTGRYELKPLTSPVNNCYKIKSANSQTEYFIVEYRVKDGMYESNLPGTGLLIYRINSESMGNASGSSDEVYLYRPGGTPTTNGNCCMAYFSASENRSAINNYTDPACFLSDFSNGDLDISDVGKPDSTISFFVNMEVKPIPPVAGFTAGKTLIFAGEEILLHDQSDNYPTSWLWSFDGGIPSFSTEQNPKVRYNNAGTYKVSLSVTNSSGSSFESKTDYIVVHPLIPGYCSASGDKNSPEWIRCVNFDNVANLSGGVGYSDFTGMKFPVLPGKSYPISLTPGFSCVSQPENWTVWIDINADGKFNNQTEVFFTENSKTSVVTGFIHIPSCIILPARMRISMKHTGQPDPCESFTLGEVEDYQLVANSNNLISGTSPAIEDRCGEVSIYPNPVKNFLNLNLKNFSSGDSFTIVNSQGVKVAWQQILSSVTNIPVNGLSAGLYVVIVENGSGTFRRKFLKE